MLPHPVTNFEIQKNDESKSKVKVIYSRNNLPKNTGGTYVINPDAYKSPGTHWIALYDSFSK